MADEPPPTMPSTGPPRPRLRRWPLVAGAVATLVLIGLIAAGWVASAWMSDIPSIPERDALWRMRRTPGIRFLDHDGALIAARGAKYGARVGLGDLPPFVPKAFLAAEDRRFYSHGAIDPQGILRAVRRDLLSLGRAAEGGSTISQQLARTLFLTSEHSLKRKVQEAVLAQRLEDLVGKNGVFELYLNRAYFGAGAYGLDSAAHTYFGKSASALTPAGSRGSGGAAERPDPPRAHREHGGGLVSRAAHPRYHEAREDGSSPARPRTPRSRRRRS